MHPVPYAAPAPNAAPPRQIAGRPQVAAAPFVPPGARLLPSVDFASLPGAKIIKLAYPIEWRGVPIKEIPLRRPIGRDMHALPSSASPGAEDMFPFFALLAGVEDEMMDELDASDIGAIGNFIDACSKSDRRPVNAKSMAGKSSIEIDLDWDVTTDGMVRSKLHMRRPKGRDMRELPSGAAIEDPTSMFRFYATLCDVPSAIIEEMDMADIRYLGEISSTFFRPRPVKK
jgi:hypothetical protein